MSYGGLILSEHIIKTGFIIEVIKPRDEAECDIIIHSSVDDWIPLSMLMEWIAGYAYCIRGTNDLHVQGMKDGIALMRKDLLRFLSENKGDG
jgi:hypothetical protein